ALTIKNTEEENKLVLRSLLVHKENQRYRFSFAPDGLELQGKPWAVNEKNFIEFGPNYFYVDQLLLKHETQSISAQSDSSTLRIKFNEFNLHTVAQIAEQEDSLVQGILDGEISLKDYFTQPAFTSDLKLKN